METQMTTEGIKALRQRLGWTQERMARELGVSTQSISRWENGRTWPLPSLDRALRRLAELNR